MQLDLDMNDFDRNFNNVVANDIDRWSQDKLLQWLNDSMMRYEAADVPMSVAYVNTISLLLRTLAKGYATGNVPAKEIAVVLVEVIESYRRQRQAEA